MKTVLFFCTILSISLSYAVPENYADLSIEEKAAAIRNDIYSANSNVSVEEMEAGVYCYGAQYSPGGGPPCLAQMVPGKAEEDITDIPTSDPSTMDNINQDKYQPVPQAPGADS